MHGKAPHSASAFISCSRRSPSEVPHSAAPTVSMGGVRAAAHLGPGVDSIPRPGGPSVNEEMQLAWLVPRPRPWSTLHPSITLVSRQHHFGALDRHRHGAERLVDAAFGADDL